MAPARALALAVARKALVVVQLVGLWAGLGLIHGGQLVHGRGVAPGGSCVGYPAEGGFCSDFGLGGEQVFLFDGVGALSERDGELKAGHIAVQRVTQATASSACAFHFQRLICSSWFPPCDANENPRLLCQSLCEVVNNDFCQKSVTAAKALGFESYVLDCDGDLVGALGDDQASVTIGLLPDFLAGWEGRLIFQEDTYIDDALPGSPSVSCLGEGGDATAACTPQTCPEPYLEARYPHLLNESLGAEFRNPGDLSFCANMTNDMDCERCMSRCEPPCKYDFLFTEGEFAALATVQWLPGLLALPLNVLVFANERSKLHRLAKRRTRSVTERLVYFSAVFGVLLFFIDGLPAMILGDDVRCAGHATHSPVINFDGSSWCWFAKIKVHLLQALMFTVVCTLHRLRMHLQATLTMTRYRPSQATRLTFVFLIFVLPLLLALGTFLGESDQLYEVNFLYGTAQNEMNGRDEFGFDLEQGFLHMPNNLRYSYSCGPKMRTVSEEILVYQGPLILAGLMCMGLSVSLMRIVGKMSDIAKSMAARTRDPNGETSEAMRSFAASMVRFAVINVALVLLNTVLTVLYLPQAKQFSKDFELWQLCVTTGIDFRGRDVSIDGQGAVDGLVNNGTTLADNEAFCGRISDFAPNPLIVVLGQGAQTLPPLAFGIVFAIPALGQLKAAVSRHVTITKVRPTRMRWNTGANSPSNTALSTK